jgi:hypothetical protein
MSPIGVMALRGARRTRVSSSLYSNLLSHERVRGDGVLQLLAPWALEAADPEGGRPKHVAEGVLFRSCRRRGWSESLERAVVDDNEVEDHVEVARTAVR